MEGGATRRERTQVGIVGAGPAGLVLSLLLQREGIDSVVLERRSREHVERRVRAGVLEQGTVDLLHELGVGGRLAREGLVHRGIEFRFEGERHRIPLADLTGGRTITIYGQQDVVKDLIDARLRRGGPLHFEVDDVSLHGLAAERPGHPVHASAASRSRSRCDVIAGCDGQHGVCRDPIPDAARITRERHYPVRAGSASSRPSPRPPRSWSTPRHERGLRAPQPPVARP